VSRSLPLALILCLQSCLLFSSLNLLPMWTDEMFTVRTVAHPVREILPIVQQDIHPPLYFLCLRAWRKLPLPWTGIAALRAFSAIWAVLATLLFDLFLARRLRPPGRWLALSLFAFSPCLLLYGRMARSYSMQTALTLLAIAMLLRWLDHPRSKLAPLTALLCTELLLYTHYVPGIALLAGFAWVSWRRLGAARLGAFSLAILICYAPWAVTLAEALRKWGQASGFSSRYEITGSAALEHVAKIGFGVVSGTVGESFFALSLLLVPVILLLALSGAREPEFSSRLAALIAVAAVVGYIGVAHWVSYPFVPARLLWLLPFLMLALTLGIFRLKRPAIRWAVVSLIGISYFSSAVLYFRREQFLNHGYSVPLDRIAATLNREAGPRDFIVLDAFNTDGNALATYLSGRTPDLVLLPERAGEARARTKSAATVWMVRNTRDISPGHITTLVEAEACAGRRERDLFFEPYAPWQQTAMKIAGMRPVLTHFYRVTECGPESEPAGK
jgi:hypothetical protein